MTSTAQTLLAVAQFAPTADTDANLAEIARLSAESASRGARVVLFPEYSSYFINPFDHTFTAHAQPLDGPFTRALRRLAAEHGLTIVAGLVEEGADAARVRNTAVAVDATGVVAHYRKAHLYDAFGQRESDWVEPGALEAPQLFEVCGIRFGLLTCYDLRFPEAMRVVVDAGADAVLMPAEWVRGPLKEHHWQSLLTARAIENTVWVAGADHPPPIGVGQSLVIDPQGVVVAGIGTGTGIAVAQIDTAKTAEVRRSNPVLELRRYRVIPR